MRELEKSRPDAVSVALKSRILDSLPKEGVVKLNEAEQRKLATLEQVLSVHHRQSFYEIKVIAVPQASLVLHARSVVLISKPALALLDSSELQAAVAHEVGHEYVWNQHHVASKEQNAPHLRELELFCDGVALVTLRLAGLAPTSLVTGLEKVTRYNRRRFGNAPANKNYPSIEDRKRFAQAVIVWLAGTDSPNR